ncbi:hypothetical protein ACFO1B_12450 [Dactylosporangium siamense]|uniref:Transporter n=1 Tax=Dactylosporangium siamense TaxID=685454 RepID=A0A919UFX6_9ACTN|nr:hypothetical protein [Dactylosporangium siamense]GIG49093.1 transporter [Dactylosporangium siamense]
MIRLAWRLARPNLVSSAVLLAVVVGYAVLTNRAMTAQLRDSGLDACIASGGDCDLLAQAFSDRFNLIINSFGLLNLAPMLLGVFWGGPLVARELEQGTHRLVWTQSHGRGRWLAARLGLYLAGAVAVTAIMTEVMTWWFKPLERVQVEGDAAFGRLNSDVFDFRGIVPLAYTVFAFAVGVAAGALFKRTIPAMVATLAIYLPVKIGVLLLRERFQPPLTETYPFGTTSPRAGKGDWRIAHEVIDKAGTVTNRVSVPAVCRTLPDEAAMRACVTEQGGYRFVDTYQPVGRFWTFQLIESGIFVGLSAAVLALAVWWVVRKLA